jgi:chromosome segregation and condensation protein ScpB
MQSIKEYIKEGITIEKTNEGYRVFTIPTQHFNIKDLDELTPERFEEEIQKQKEWQKLENDILGEYFKDLF